MESQQPKGMTATKAMPMTKPPLPRTHLRPVRPKYMLATNAFHVASNNIATPRMTAAAFCSGPKSVVRRFHWAINSLQDPVHKTVSTTAASVIPQTSSVPTAAAFIFAQINPAQVIGRVARKAGIICPGRELSHLPVPAPIIVAANNGIANRSIGERMGESGESRGLCRLSTSNAARNRIIRPAKIGRPSPLRRHSNQTWARDGEANG